ncbi:hypothetical protein L2E82_15176 [Cichorium intybus]|uniref:Uncharacterized protein n=1 Tax=Cichorium intybus TaxID=13427 RepID=A0ACB9F235_CICIN|nr:hypothetical protein L2E82_15176 [Cichorium intybus]
MLNMWLKKLMNKSKYQIMVILSSRHHDMLTRKGKSRLHSGTSQENGKGILIRTYTKRDGESTMKRKMEKVQRWIASVQPKIGNLKSRADGHEAAEMEFRGANYRLPAVWVVIEVVSRKRGSGDTP